MKVLHVIVGLNTGGAELMLKRLIEGGANNVEHSVISLTDIGTVGKLLQDRGVKVFTLGISKRVWSLFPAIVKMINVVRAEKPDVMQTWMYHSDILGGLIARVCGVDKVFWNVRNTNLHGRGIFNYFLRRLCGVFSYVLPDAVVYVSRSALKSHINAGYSKRKAVLIFNGFDCSVYAPSDSVRSEIRREIEIKDDEFLICSVGRCVEAKDHGTFIRAISYASQFNPHIKGLMIGRGLTEANAEIFSGIETSNIDKFVLLGERDDVPRLLCASDVFCLHSITEGFPNVLGEAMLTALPCVTTDCGDAADIVGDSKYVRPCGDYKGLGDAVLALSQKSSSELNDIGERNRERIQKEYSIGEAIKKYESLWFSF
tara:strand:+ start:9445 stop:10557 length:1113 start_codon:yes stop_codon:yes gene_type:complete